MNKIISEQQQQQLNQFGFEVRSERIVKSKGMITDVNSLLGDPDFNEKQSSDFTIYHIYYGNNPIQLGIETKEELIATIKTIANNL